MKKILFLLPVALLAAAPSFATESRVQGLGGIGFYVTDDTNIFVFPQTLTKHVNSAQIELGAPNTFDVSRHGGGAAHIPRMDVTAGLYVNRGAGAPLMGMYDNISPGQENRIIVAKNSWGFALGIGSDTWEDKEAADAARQKETGTNFSFGAGGDFMLGKAAAQIGAEIAIGSGKREYNDNSAAEVDESAMTFRIANRNHYDRGSSGKLVSVLTFGMATNEIDPDGDTIFETTATSFGLGAGWHYPAGKNTTVIFGIEPFGYTSIEEKDTVGGEEDTETLTVMTLGSVFLAVEGKIKSWLEGRAGISQSNRRNTVKFEPGDDALDDEEETFSDSDMNVSMGLSFILSDNFTIDAVFNDQYLHNGFNFLTGVNNGQPLMSNVSVKANW